MSFGFTPHAAEEIAKQQTINILTKLLFMAL
jgi:hypothetical protein